MPNWCINYVTVNHNEPEMITKACEALRAGNLFETFVPFANGEWDYGWCNENWGTKWDATCVDCYNDESSATLIFETAWGPPIAFLKALEDLGFDIDATYHEPGLAFAGHYYDGDDNHYEYDFSNPDWVDDIDDEDVLEMLEEEYNQYLEWQDDQEEED